MLTSAPRWLSTDLRDGNQALLRPMDPARKLAMFDLLARMGYKEIEVGFPVASTDDYEFVRLLIEQDMIPDDVTISVMVQAKDEQIMRTMLALSGASRATIHLYNATSPLFRQLVFGITRDECKNMAVQGTKLMMKYARQLLPECDLGFEYSPEIFNETELDFALEVCESVMDVWEPASSHEIILNFPATVERATPNIFADQIEWLDRNLSRRDHVCLSIHPHNDRGTGVAAAELAMLAGAQRIEGCLLGGGERAGNVDLVTLGLNLYTQGIDPGIDFSDIPLIRKVVENCTEMPVHDRHPYAGDLIFTSLSGSHQDAIKKGFDAMEREARAAGKIAAELPWRMPYLPMDPGELGRAYEPLIRISSQSGKGGVGYIMSAKHGIDLPSGLCAEFAAIVQAAAERSGGELTEAEVGALFDQHYFGPSVVLDEQPMPSAMTLYLDPAVDAPDSNLVRTLLFCLDAWGTEVTIIRHAHSRRDRSGSLVLAECVIDGRSMWAAGRGIDVIAATGAAIGSALGRAQCGSADEQVRR